MLRALLIPALIVALVVYAGYYLVECVQDYINTRNPPGGAA